MDLPMPSHALLRSFAAIVALSALPAFSQSRPGATLNEERVDLAAIQRIKAEAFEDSKVMEHLFYLTDVNGPRLTNSPGQRAAADWAVRTLASWGIDNAHLETWGKFGRGWSLSRFTMSLDAPVYAPLPGIPLAWSAGTHGVVRGDAVF